VNYNGTDTFTYKANDGTSDSNVAMVTITINAANDAPVATNDFYSTDEDTALSVLAAGVLANDNDIDTPASNLTAILVTGPTHAASFALNSDGSFSYTPVANFNGTDTFTYKANDGTSDSNVAMVQITVANVNEAPTDIALSNNSVAENQPTSTTVGTLSATDPDAGDTHTFTLVAGTGSTDNASFQIVGNALKTDAIFDYETKNSYSVRIRSTDQGALFTEKVFTISVTNVNEAPVITEGDSTTINMSEDGSPTAFSLTLHATDPEGDTLTWSISTPAGHGTASASGTGASKAIGYTPNANYNGTDSFVVQVSDGNGGSDTITVNVNIAAVDDAPVASNASTTTNEDTAVTVTLSASDIDSASLSFSVVGSPSHGTLGTISAPNCTANGAGSSCTATVTYTPTANYNGPDSFTFKVNDGSLDSNVATVSITINATAPLSIGASLLPDAEVGLHYSADLGIGGGADPYTVMPVKGSLPSGLIPDSDGISGIPTRSTKKSVFSLKVTDQMGASATKQFRIKVFKALNISTQTLKRAKVGKNYKASLKVTGGKAPYTWTLDSGTFPAWAQLSPSGVITGVPPAPDSQTFTLQVIDALGGTDLSQSLTLTAN
jgi:VCBS repeat-containing protein